MKLNCNRSQVNKTLPLLCNPGFKAIWGHNTISREISIIALYGIIWLKRLAQAKIIKKSVILFWLLNMTI